MDGEHENEGSRPGLSAVWREWVAPVAAAAVVALAVAGAIELTGDTERKAEKAKARQEEHAPPQPLLTAPRRTAPGFVVAVQRPGTAVVVRDLASGAVIDQTMPPPAGQRFHQVAAVPDGSYVLSGYGRQRVAFYRLRLSGEGRAQAFTPLPRAISGVSTAWSDMAVSADGDKIGYVTYQGNKARLTVLSVRSGAYRTWRAPDPGRVRSLSWAGGTLSFVWTPARTAGSRAAHQVRILDTTRPGGDLRASRPVRTLPENVAAAVISRDGTTIVTGVPHRSGVTLAAFSAATGRQTRVLRRFATGVTALTLDGAGGHLLVAAADGRLYAGSAQATHRLSAADFADLAW